ncbi:MAG: acyl-CoA dehydratase activase-related protein [Peptococcaceae bacterium]|nr:acyl-CoA dehydratase activase-related protein [Peptococcaceae bacterium]
MKLVVGLPSPLRRHEYPGLWEDFFQRLGVQVILSPPTNKILFNSGIKMCSGDVCLPLKVLHGHVLYLHDRADAVFVPRYVYPAAREAACPKFCALPDILRLNLPGVTVWDMSVDMNKGLAFMLSTLDEMVCLMEQGAHEDCENNADKGFFERGKARAAFIEALTRPQASWYSRLLSEYTKDREGSGGRGKSVQAGRSGITGLDDPAIGIIGHAYLTQDAFLTMNLATKIADRGYRVVTSEDVPYNLKRQRCSPYQNRTFWGVGVDLLGTALTMFEEKNIKGLIYVTSFACGIDSVALELLDRQIIPGNDKPCMRLCLDEHTGESGFDTRLEAFFDLLPL